jgi:diguanylate cyclase (GGDEF)-like protein
VTAPHAILVVEADWQTSRQVVPFIGEVTIGGPPEDIDAGTTAPLAIVTWRDGSWRLRPLSPVVMIDDHPVVEEIELRHGQRIASPDWHHRLWFLAGDDPHVLHELRHVETVIDPMTSLLTRRGALRRLDRMRDGALLMIDIDRLKRINDQYGMGAGELTLHRMGRILRDLVAWPNLTARYGGEEFFVIMPGADLVAARATAEQIRIAAEPTFLYEGEALTATVSIGLALHSPTTDVNTTIRAADEALANAKTEGRNRVVG